MSDNYINEQTDPEVLDILQNVTETSQEEAALTIDRANAIGMNPDDYAEPDMREQLEPELMLHERIPATVDPTVKNMMKLSGKMAEVIKPEISLMDKVSKQAKYMWYNLYEKRELDNEIFDLEEKNIAGELNTEQLDYLNGLYDLRQEEIEEFGIEGFEEVPGQVAGVIGDLGETFVENKEFLALTIGGGAALGTISPLPGITTLGGAGGAAALAIPTAMGMFQYRKIKLSTFGELRRAVDEKTGEPLNLPKDTVENISIGVGLATGALEALFGKLLTGTVGKLIPTKQLAKEVAKRTALRGALTNLGQVAKVSIANAGEEVTGELASLVGERYAQGHQSEEGVINAIYQVIDDIKNDPATQERLKLTAVVGGVAGGTITSGTIGLSKIATSRIGQTQKITEDAIKSLENQNESIKYLTMMEQSKLMETHPNILSEMSGQMFNEAGYTDRIWISQVDMDIITENNPQLAEQLQSMDVTEAGNSGAPIGITPHQFYDLVREVPTVSEYARLHPEAPNPLESRNWLKRLQEAEEERQKILGELDQPALAEEELQKAREELQPPKTPEVVTDEKIEAPKPPVEDVPIPNDFADALSEDIGFQKAETEERIAELKERGMENMVKQEEAELKRIDRQIQKIQNRVFENASTLMEVKENLRRAVTTDFNSILTMKSLRKVENIFKRDLGFGLFEEAPAKPEPSKQLALEAPVKTYEELDEVSREMADERIDLTLQTMREDIESSEAGKRGAVENPEFKRAGQQDYLNTATKSTFPTWFRELGTNKKNFLRAIESGKGKLYNRIIEKAKEIAQDGYQSKNIGDVMPDNMYRQILGLPAIDEQGNEIPVTRQDLDLFIDVDNIIDEGIKQTGLRGYLDQPTFTEAIEGVIDDKQVESFNKAQLDARVDVADQIQAQFERGEKIEENRIVRAKMKVEKEAQVERLNKDLEVVEKFRFKKGDTQVTGHKKKNFSRYAIDPKFLPEDVREVYLTDPKLKKRKVFVEGGITPDESAGLVGVKDSRTLLDILANAPTQQEMIAERKATEAEIRKITQDLQKETFEERLNKVFDNLTKAHLKEMKFMREQRWPQAKVGIRKIALPLPRIPEIQLKAKNTVARTKVGELNIRQYNAGEKSAQRQAVNHILKNEVEKAFVAKEKAILNNELTRETIRVKNEVTKAKAMIKRVTSRKGLKTFKKAGMEKDITDILRVFDMRDEVSKKKKTEQEAFLDYAKDLDAQGESFDIPESLSDIRQRGSDLTSEQYLRIAERIQTLEKQAKDQNKLFKENEVQAKAGKIQTEEAIVEPAVLDLQEHRDYDEKRLKDIKNINSKTEQEKRREGFSLWSAGFTNFKNIVTELDQEKLGGKHYNILAQPLVNSETFKRSKNLHLVEQIKKIAADYGEDNFNRAFNEFIVIDEFEGIVELGGGKMVKSDLWLLFAYLGDPQGRERIGNFINPDTNVQLTVETVTQALEKHLSHADAKVAQNFVNIFKSFEADSMALHERTTGVTPNMVKSVPIEFKGKVYDGGYVPLNYLNVNPEEAATRFLEVLGKKQDTMFGGTDEGKLYSQLRAAEQTEQGRLIDRTGSSRALDTNFHNFLHAFEETIHDLAYRESGSDALKLLRNPLYQKAIISTVGVPKYKTLINSVIETVGNVSEDDTLNPFKENVSQWKRIYRYGERGFNIATLGFNVKSILMQPLSFGAAQIRMGKGGTKYLAKAAAHILSNLDKYPEIFKQAAEINPDLLFNKDSVDDTVIESTFEFIPKTKQTTLIDPHTYSALRKGHEYLTNISMLGLRKLDIHIKALTTMAAYNQFLDGNVTGWDLKKLDKLTDVEKETKARQYSKQIADLALTTSATIDKSFIEKVNMLRIFTRFYTDRRAQLNTAFAEGRRIKYALKDARNALTEGDTTKAINSAKASGAMFANFVMVWGLIQMYQDMLYGDDEPISELARVRNMEDLKNWAHNTVTYVAKAPFKALAGTAPFTSDIQYALGSPWKTKRVGLPVTSALSEVAMGITGLADLLEGNDLSKKQKRALLFNVSFLIGGLPVNGPQKILDMLDEPMTDAAQFVAREAIRAGKAIDKYIEKNPNETEVIKELEKIKKEVIPPQPQNVDEIIPEDAMEVMKTNEWDDLNKDTGAAGVYQFTEERWDEISEQNPELGLTDEGRTSKDSTEQETAMKWNLEDLSKGLMAYNIPVTNANLYGAHRFGLDDFAVVVTSKNDVKIKDIVSNPTLFKGFTSVKQVKRYVNSQLKIDNKTP